MFGALLVKKGGGGRLWTRLSPPPPGSASTHRDAGFAICGAKLHLAMQVDVAVGARKLEHVEGEGVGHSVPIAHQIHRLVLRVGTPAATHTHQEHALRQRVFPVWTTTT